MQRTFSSKDGNLHSPVVGHKPQGLTAPCYYLSGEMVSGLGGVQSQLPRGQSYSLPTTVVLCTVYCVGNYGKLVAGDG